MGKNRKEGVSDSEIEGFFDDYAGSLKLNLLINKLLADNELKIENEDIDVHINNYLKQNFHDSNLTKS